MSENTVSKPHDGPSGGAAAADALCDQGTLHHRAGRLAEALTCFDAALLAAPDSARAHYLRGVVLHDLRRHQEALSSYRAALAIEPDKVNAHLNCGLILAALGRPQEALAAFDRAAALDPADAEALNNRGLVLHELGRHREALASFDAAIARAPHDAFAYANRGRLLKDMKRPEEAITACNEALKRNPDLAGAISNRALCELAMGDFASGFADYEARHKVPGAGSPPLSIGAPEWAGEALEGRAILVRAEQGLGDIIQFARYLPQLARAGAEVTFVVTPRMHRLLAGLGVGLAAAPPAGARFDFQCALLSLPHILRTERASIPAAVPYLAADPERVSLWRARLGEEGLRIGVCWNGGPKSPGRSFPLRALDALSRLPEVRLISLQKEDGLGQLAALPPGMHVETPGGDFDSGADAFRDCAAVLECVDLVVSCDTSVAHLAGALARPVWLALRYAPDWRWMLEGSDTPWYPTMRLFRQEEDGDWRGVFEDMRARLAARACGE